MQGKRAGRQSKKGIKEAELSGNNSAFFMAVILTVALISACIFTFNINMKIGHFE
jgi:hypothetical protein